ncbi:hypothetical protein KC343_g3645 [Hortaea werneckii]|uniref:AB hydrolase-1 domain-containing protein n=1 Tax=Hortaea werneckii TaxID=91943 RepID=A0A3M7DT05_HORWE|nr:hypothetical protein KC352_g11252 [Hortaea werneckii]KAI7570305.1 hypothetical protein KC317_g2580 [Hortaea werneckii]KAI7621576.1 hypothetical protein KC346_g3577 [Hortaea werneckii]KAI7632119.1 hypothetical protein KC343_g3645 [Hortaea werneckii]KAI7674112.1 hypothetical protein KC319_g4894 [Hortaea werneckii]
MAVTTFIAQAFAILHGSTTLVYLTILALVKRLRKPDSRADHETVSQAYHDLWNLETSRHQHSFIEADGLQLHCLSNNANQRAPNLVILLHGFPDSAHVFDNLLASRRLANTDSKLVALGLPGYGGSDTPKDFGAETFRIAAETERLVDRVVVLNSMHLPHGRARLSNQVTKCNGLLAQWKQDPLNSLQKGWQELRPVKNQLMKSSYIFMFNLPYPLQLLSTALEFLVNYCHRQIAPTKRRIHVISAASNGPSEAEAASRNAAGQTYGPSVLRRAKTDPPGDWLQRIRIYREGLATRSWKPCEAVLPYVPSKEEVSKSERKAGKLRYPTTIVFGLDDLAFDINIALDGIEDFFPSEDEVGGRRSHVVWLKGQGHWFFTQPQGAVVLERVMFSLLEKGDGGGLQGDLAREADQGGVDVTTH